MKQGLEVLHTGPANSVQDMGRVGYQRFGVSVSGAMDLSSAAAANALLGNAAEAPLIELGGYGGRFRVLAQEGLSVALYGGVFDLRLQGVEQAWGRVLSLRPGDVLEIGAARCGHYGYLALPGGLACTPILGSCATQARAGLGGLSGEMLNVGDQLWAAETSNGSHTLMHLPLPDEDKAPIRVLPGPQWSRFSARQQQQFLERTYRVSNQRDRMGIRLQGQPLSHEGSYDVLSEGVAAGSIQITGEGLPIVLMADRQPTGGYPKIATVIQADFARMAQWPSGRECRFEQVSPEQALALYRQYRAALRQWPQRCQRLLRDPHEMPDLLSYNLVDGMVRGDEAL